MPHKSDIAALVSARICHDLISPIGAIGNGIELLMLDQPAESAELDLINASVAQANARIRFFRLAYGSGGSDQRVAKNEVLGALESITQHGRLQIELNAPSEMSRPEVKLMLLLLQCIEAATPWGGQVLIENDGDTWQLAAKSAKIRPLDDLWQQLMSPEGVQTQLPTNIQFTLAWRELRRTSRTLSHKITATEIILGF